MCILSLIVDRGFVARPAVVAAAVAERERSFRPCFPEMLKSWGDPKKAVREAASKAVGAYAAMCGPLERGGVLPALATLLVDPKLPLDGRREALAWLLEALDKYIPCASAAAFGAASGASDFSPALACCAAGLQDKASEIRELAGKVLAGLGATLGEAGV